MKKNLLTVPLGIQHFRWYTLRLIAVFLLSPFCIMQVNGAVIDSAASQNDPHATIFVSAGTVITGMSQFSNAQIVQIPTASPAKKVLKAKSPTSLSKQIVVKKETDDRRLKLIQEKINKKIKNIYYSSSQDSDLLRFAKVQTAAAATFNSSSFKYQKAIVSIDEELHIFKIKNRKQKFFTSLSYSEFQKLRNSFLRGPPRSI